MEYLHQSTYGHAGGFHTARPVMAMDRAKGTIYDIKNGRPDLKKPIYEIRGEHAYSTEYHPGGASPHATFQIRDNALHATQFHPHHGPSTRLFEIRR